MVLGEEAALTRNLIVVQGASRISSWSTPTDVRPFTAQDADHAEGTSLTKTSLPKGDSLPKSSSTSV